MSSPPDAPSEAPAVERGGERLPPSGGSAPSIVSGERGRALFIAAYVVAAVVTVAGIWLVAVAPNAGGDEGQRAGAWPLILTVLVANLVLIGVLAAIVALRVLRLARRRMTDAGVRLHLRFVTLFSLAAVAPAILIALAFGVLVNRGVDGWFSQNVRSSVVNSAAIGRAYVQDVNDQMDRDIRFIEVELESIRPTFDRRIEFNGYLAQISQLYDYSALYLLSGEGEVLAQGEQAGAPPFLTPPRDAFATAAAGEEVPLDIAQNPDSIRALYPLPAYGDDSYLYMVRPLQPGLIGQMFDAEQSIVAYRAAEQSRAQIQTAFALSYIETALLVLVGAVWLGMTAANAISAPVGRLVRAADKVAGGDLGVRVDTSQDPEEIAVLSRAFNRMTGDLETQQAALISASDEAQARSRFIETVLSGVSAGVIGLDRDGRVSAINESALALLRLEETATLGRPLVEAAPEFAPFVERGDAHADGEIDLDRDGEARRLRVRAEGGVGGEMVLTFDDMTRLVTAQRNAAWRDVARRIAHEIKNPLTPIQLSAERLRRKYRKVIGEDVETFDRCTETIIRQVGDIGRMVDEFSAFARMPAPRIAPEAPAEMLREAVFAQRVALAEVEVMLVEPLPAVTLDCDGRMVGQALTNLLKNAGEAVMARRAADGHADGGIRAALEMDGQHLTFVIEDDGVGLPPARERERLTEPYVTTREKGTGLGLAIVKKILEDHGGELRLGDAVELNGARMCLMFPMSLVHTPKSTAPASAVVA